MHARIRGSTEKDLPSIVELVNQASAGTHEFTPYTADKIREWIVEGNFKVLVAEEGKEIVGSVSYRNGHWGENIEWLAVAEETSKEVIENELVQEIEKQVKGEKVFTAVDENSPRIDDWVERGYKAEGGLYHMVAELTTSKSLPKIPEGIILRSLRTEEEKEFVVTVNAGFGWERLETGIIQKWKTECPPFDEEWVHVAETDDKIVSAVGSRPDVEYNEFFHGKRGYLGPAATLPEYRGKHLASALTLRAMNHLLEKGMTSASLYTSEQNKASIGLLLNLGFRKVHLWKFMRKTLQKT
jgi:ribosomal protein S18 acetylase RimI-like enzyme